ncbi:MAG: hypothetical protein O7E52_19200 [Candidatus Poribacteria bacterium]|nr:hypothetical protein [Candidatus Poribacteria bacterium]
MMNELSVAMVTRRKVITGSKTRKDLIGAKARADLEEIPGGKELLTQHDDSATPAEKALSQFPRQGSPLFQMWGGIGANPFYA